MTNQYMNLVDVNDASFLSIDDESESLECLSGDSISVIFSFLTSLEILQIRVTCKQWHRIAENYSPSNICYQNTKWNCQKVFSHLKRYFKNLDVVEDIDFCPQFSVILNYISNNSKSQLKNVRRIGSDSIIFNPLNSTYFPMNISVLKDDERIQFLSHLEHKFPNVRILNLSTVSTSFDPTAVCSVFQNVEVLTVIPRFMPQDEKNVPRFPKLKKLVCRNKNGTDLNFLQVLVSFPNLSHLEMSIRGTSAEERFVSRLELIGTEESHIQDTLHTLKIKFEQVDSKKLLIDLLSAFKALKCLHFQESIFWRQNHGFTEYDLRSILMNHRQLEELVLTSTFEIKDTFVEFVLEELKSLKKFSLLAQRGRRIHGYKLMNLIKRFDNKCELDIFEREKFSSLKYLNRNREKLKLQYEGSNAEFKQKDILRNLRELRMDVLSQDDLLLSFGNLMICELNVKNQNLRRISIDCPRLEKCEVAMNRKIPKLCLFVRSEMLRKFVIQNCFHLLHLETPVLRSLSIPFSQSFGMKKNNKNRVLPRKMVLEHCPSLVSLGLPDFAIPQLINPIDEDSGMSYTTSYNEPEDDEEEEEENQAEFQWDGRNLPQITSLDVSFFGRTVLWESCRRFQNLKVLHLECRTKCEFRPPPNVVLFVEEFRLTFRRVMEFEAKELHRLLPFVQNFHFKSRKSSLLLTRKFKELISLWDHLHTLKLDQRCRRDGSVIREILNENNHKIVKADIRTFYQYGLEIYSPILRELTIRMWCPWRMGNANTGVRITKAPNLRILRTNCNVLRATKEEMKCHNLKHIIIDFETTPDRLLEFMNRHEKSFPSLQTVGVKIGTSSKFSFLNIQELFPNVTVYKITTIDS